MTFGSKDEARAALESIDVRKRQEQLAAIGLPNTGRRIGEAYEAAHAVVANDEASMRDVHLATRRLQSYIG